MKSTTCAAITRLIVSLASAGIPIAVDSASAQPASDKPANTAPALKCSELPAFRAAAVRSARIRNMRSIRARAIRKTRPVSNAARETGSAGRRLATGALGPASPAGAQAVDDYLAGRCLARVTICVGLTKRSAMTSQISVLAM
jgi:hypothetical protein